MGQYGRRKNGMGYSLKRMDGHVGMSDHHMGVVLICRAIVYYGEKIVW